MHITYFRSSSYNTHEDCQQRYFIESNLGWGGPSGKAADSGTIVHKALEILAMIKVGQQNGKKTISDKITGRISTSKFDLDKILEKCFGYYTELLTHHNWEEKDYKFCHKTYHKALTASDGMFNPLHRDIVEPELHFDFCIKKDWAKYTYDGIEGYLAMKGTIDLTTKIADDTLEVIDWKTGLHCKNFATGKEYTCSADFHDNMQLRIYHYAVHQTFPEIEQVMMTMFFINAGGPFTVCFDKNDLIKTEECIREKFEAIKKNEKPKLIQRQDQKWKCRYLCPFGKTTFADTDIKPIQEFRRGQVTKKGEFMTKCEQVKFEIERKGMQRVIEEYSADGHCVSKYKAPGEVE